MKAIKKIILFLMISMPVLSLSAGENGWELITDDKGITIENRAIEGFKMKQLRARTVVDAPIEVIYEVMDTPEMYDEWFGDCVLQKDIKRISEYEKICYHVMDVPWPLSDRDAIARVTTKADWQGGKVIYRVDSIRQPEDSKWGMDSVTEEEDRVRMPVMDGVFIFSRITPGKSDFTYIAIADPGIPLPGWILNVFSTKQPFDTLVNLKKQVKKPIYWEKAARRHGKEFTPPVKK